MSIWNNAVMTTKGLALLARLIDGSTVTITRVVTGAGKAPLSSLAAQTAVTLEKQTLKQQDTEIKSDGTANVPVILTNTGLETAYTAYQVGFYVTDPSQGEILYCIAQDDTGELIPTEADSPGFTIEWNFGINFGNASSVNVTIDQTGLVTYEGGDARYAAKYGDIDCGLFDDAAAVLRHAATAAAHAKLTVDGVAAKESAAGDTLAEHEVDGLAHQNLIVDGNNL